MRLTSRRDVLICCRGLAAGTKPLLKERIDKETCGKIIEAAEAVKDGTQEVVSEVKRVGETITERVTTTAGNIAVDVAKKGFEKAAQNAESKNSKDFLDTARAAAEAYTERSDNKND
ncbi:hypothetical protein M569_02941 [Genlisea aurea]|uniref:Uncharacterized protein n=1 Tax=Genlisea aurea TaxID=192259 RepID=S8D341_9LAMI|nr:hypothetical protein M569_02941 [Genlisea aurea]